MRPKHKRSLSPEVGRSGWGCFPAYNSKNELFLAKNDSPSYKTQKLTTLEHHRHGSGINYVAPVKVSLKNKRENKPNPIPPQVREDTQQCVSNHNSQLFIPGPKPLLSPQHSFSSSAYQVRPQTSHHPPIIHFITVQPQLTVTPISLSFSTQQQPPSIQIRKVQKQAGSQQDETKPHLVKIEVHKAQVPSCQTTIGASQPESLQESEKSKEDRLRKYRSDLKIPDILNVEKKKVTEAGHNPEPQILSPVEPKQATSKSLMTSNKIFSSQQEQDRWVLSEPVRSFCSEKNVRKRRIQRMSEVEEIKSQPDSEELSNSSNQESIVLGRLEEIDSFLIKKQVQGSAIAQNKLYPSNSSIQLRETQ